MSLPKVLFVLTSEDTIPGSERKTGWYLPEFAHPWAILTPYIQTVVASPLGGAAPMDPGSIAGSKDDPISADFLKNQSALWEKTEKLEKFIGKADEFAAIFYVGGHGPMFDLAHSPTSHALINEFHSLNKTISAVCHGPAALAYVKLPDSSYFLSGSPVTGFSNSEEDVSQSTQLMPFSLETQLNLASGGKYEKAEADWGTKVVVTRGGKLITGQNPGSAKGCGEAILEAIKGTA